MNSLTKPDAFLDALDCASDELDIRKLLFELDTIKEALRAADMFHEKSVMFAKYEAYALIKAYEVCGDTELIKGKYRKLAAEWLVSLDATERDEYIAMCADGQTIDNIYRQKVYVPGQRAALHDAVNDCKSAAREQLRKEGTVSVPDIVHKYGKAFPKSMKREITDGVRDAVRRAGGVGIGDDRGTYIDPEKDSRYVAEAIATRISAVARDIESIAELSEKSERKPVFHIKGNGKQITVIDVVYLILSGIGCAEVTFDTPTARKSSVSILHQIAGDV